MKKYTGEYEGQHFSSLYPKLFRVSYRAYVSGRTLDVVKLMAGIDADHARGRANHFAGSTIIGPISVELVHFLDASE